MSDLTTIPEAEFWPMYEAVNAEAGRRRILLTAAARQDELNHEVLRAEGVASGDPWRQPTGGHDAYPMGMVVTHNGRRWRSLVSSNVWEPGVSGWRELAEEGGAPLPWVAPTGAHDTYSLGDQVTHKDQVWTSTIDANAFEPGVAGWVADVSGGVPPWQQPVGAGSEYQLGAVVTHKDHIWESFIANNVWEPGVHGWEDKGLIGAPPEPEEPEEPVLPPEALEESAVQEWPAWVQPVGAGDAYAVGAEVTHNGTRWVSTADANVWEPGVHGWDSVE